MCVLLISWEFAEGWAQLDGKCTVQLIAAEYASRGRGDKRHFGGQTAKSWQIYDNQSPSLLSLPLSLSLFFSLSLAKINLFFKETGSPT